MRTTARTSSSGSVVTTISVVGDAAGPDLFARVFVGGLDGDGAGQCGEQRLRGDRRASWQEDDEGTKVGERWTARADRVGRGLGEIGFVVPLALQAFAPRAVEVDDVVCARARGREAIEFRVGSTAQLSERRLERALRCEVIGDRCEDAGRVGQRAADRFGAEGGTERKPSRLGEASGPEATPPRDRTRGSGCSRCRPSPPAHTTRLRRRRGPCAARGPRSPTGPPP